MSAWIEILSKTLDLEKIKVALLVSAWIEIAIIRCKAMLLIVALLVSAWIEIVMKENSLFLLRRTLRECVD